MKKFIAVLLLASGGYVLAVWYELQQGNIKSDVSSLKTIQTTKGIKPVDFFDEPFLRSMIYHSFDRPYSMALLPDGNFLVAEKPGKIQLFDPVSKTKTTLFKISGPSFGHGPQEGILDIELHPHFEQNRWVYITHTLINYNNKKSVQLNRARLVDNQFIDAEVLLKAKAWTRSSAQFGSVIEFDADNYLYMTVGDRSLREHAQNLSNHMGKVLRMHDDGSIPEDNPFVSIEDAMPEIYSLGNRNPQGLFFDSATQTLYETEHGPRGGDEVNIIEKGKNYGWAIISYGREYRDNTQVGEGHAKPGLEQPLYYYVPSIGTSTVVKYYGQMFPQWQGDLLVGSLKGHQLSKLSLHNNEVKQEQRFIGDTSWRIRDIEIGPQGEVYLLSDAGVLVKLERSLKAMLLKKLKNLDIWLKQEVKALFFDKSETYIDQVDEGKTQYEVDNARNTEEARKYAE